MTRRGTNNVVIQNNQFTSFDLIRIQKDLQEVKDMRNVKLFIPDENDLQHFIVSIKVQEGLYRNKWIPFNFELPNDWPKTAPKVTTAKDIWHPNILLVKDGGNVCVSILQKGYVPSIRLETVVVSLQFLLQKPNQFDPRNIAAAKEFIENFEMFKAHSQMYLDEIDDD